MAGIGALMQAAGSAVSSQFAGAPAQQTPPPQAGWGEWARKSLGFALSLSAGYAEDAVAYVGEAVAQPNTNAEYAVLGLLAVAATGALSAGGYAAYQRWWAAEKGNLADYVKDCPADTVRYRNFHTQQTGCAPLNAIAVLCHHKVFGSKKKGELYCAEVKEDSADVEFTAQLQALVAEMKAVPVSQSDLQAAQEQLSAITAEEAKEKTAIGQQAVAEIKADAEKSNQVAADILSQIDKLDSDAAAIAAKQAQTTDPGQRASMQHQLEDKKQQASELVSKGTAKIEDNTKAMADSTRKAALKVSATVQKADKKVASLSKKVPIVARRKAQGTTSLFHKGRKTTVRTRKAAPVKRRVVHRKKAARVVRRKKTTRVVRRR